MIERPIALIGMPGAGKTAVGKVIASSLGVAFVDSDEVVQNYTNHTISEIFLHMGEEKFRELEYKALSIILKNQIRQVIATGGGSFANQKSQDLLLKKSIVIYLEEDDDILWERVSSNSHRPLIASRDQFFKLIQTRKALYDQSHIKIDCRALRIVQISDDIQNKLKAFYG